MKITPLHPESVYVLALDEKGDAIGFLTEIDTDKMEGYQVGYVRDRADSAHPPHRFFDPVHPSEMHLHDISKLCRRVMPIPIHELLDRRTGAAWVSTEE